MTCTVSAHSQVLRIQSHLYRIRIHGSGLANPDPKHCLQVPEAGVEDGKEKPVDAPVVALEPNHQPCLKI